MSTFKFTDEEKKSALWTVLITAILLLILFFIRFTTSSNLTMFTDGGGGGGGVTVNFGDSDFGSGDNFQSEILQVTDAKTTKKSIRFKLDFCIYKKIPQKKVTFGGLLFLFSLTRNNI